MSPKYCLPVIKSQKADVLKAIDNNLEDYSCFEVWLDYIEDLDEDFIRQLTQDLNDKLIVLFRRQNLEPIVMNLQKRLSILSALHNSQTLVDLDVRTQTAELNHIGEKGLEIKTIVSYHDYEQTPSAVQLQAIIDTMDEYQPAIYKLATLCNSQEDSLRLLRQLLELKAKGFRAIVLGMGEFGAITRVFGALWGNEMTFAPNKKAEQSAPGQLTRSQLQTILTELKS